MRSNMVYVVVETILDGDSAEVGSVHVFKKFSDAKKTALQMYREQLNPDDDEDTNNEKVEIMKSSFDEGYRSFSTGNWTVVVTKSKLA